MTEQYCRCEVSEKPVEKFSKSGTLVEQYYLRKVPIVCYTEPCQDECMNTVYAKTRKLWYENGELGMLVYYDKKGDVISKESWYSNGQNKEIMVKTGLNKGWYFSGTLAHFTVTEDDYIVSREAWFPDGSKREYITDNGVNEMWYEGGKPAYSCPIVSGMREGVCKKWYPNGVLGVECSYKDDKKEGYYVEYGESGELIRKYFFENGEMVI